MHDPKPVTVSLTVDAAIPAEALRIICRKFIQVVLKDGVRTPLCEGHAALHPEFQDASQGEPVLCVLCGAGLEPAQGIVDL